MEDMILASLDVRDAFLTVSQKTPTLVHTKDAGGTAHSFSLGKVLPGQRDMEACYGILRSLAS